MSRLQDAIRRGQIVRDQKLQEEAQAKAQAELAFQALVKEELGTLNDGHDLFEQIERAVALGRDYIEWHPWWNTPYSSEVRAKARKEAMKTLLPELVVRLKSERRRDQSDSLVDEWYLEIRWTSEPIPYD